MAEIDLGRLSVVSKEAELELLLSSSAKFAASGEDEIEQLKKRLTTTNPNEHRLLPWTHCGNSFNIRILLKIEPKLASAVQDALTDTFSLQFRTAMIWKQLQFSEPSVRTSHIEDDQIMIEATLVYSDSSATQGQRSPHKIDTDVPFSDVRAPPGILTTTLESVTLEARIRKRQHRPRRTNTRGATGIQSKTLEAIASQISITQDTAPLSDTFANHTLEVENHFMEHTPADQLLESECDGLDESEDEMLLRSEDVQDVETKIGTILDLLNTAILRAISERGAPLPKGISMADKKSIVPLSTISPAVFRPGHLQSVASRSGFLPTISSSLFNVSSRSAKLESILQKAGAQEHHLGIRSCPDRSNTVEEAKFLKGSAMKHWSKLLWLRVNSSLLAATRERRLKPLEIPRGRSELFDVSDRLLDEVDEISHVQTHQDMSGSDDLFFDSYYSGNEDVLADFDELSEYEDGEVYDYEDTLSLLDDSEPNEDILDDELSVQSDSESHGEDYGSESEMLDGNLGLNTQNVEVVETMQQEDAMSVCDSLGTLSITEKDGIELAAFEQGSDEDEMLDDNSD